MKSLSSLGVVVSLSLILFLSYTPASLADNSSVAASAAGALTLPPIPVLHLDATKSEKHIEIKQNQEIVVTLEDRSASTGFIWRWAQSNSDVLSFESIKNDLPSPIPGAPVKKEWHFKVVGTPPLKEDLAFFQSRQWDDASTPATMVIFHLVLTPTIFPGASTINASSQRDLSVTQ